VLKIR